MADEQIVTSIVARADLSSLVSEVHRASSSLQQLQRELLASNKAIASSTKLANNLFRDTLTGSGQFSSHFVNLNSDVDQFGKNLDSGRLKLKNYFSTFREHATTQKGMIRELAKEQVMLQNAVLQPLGRNAQGLMQYNVMIPRGLDAVKNSAQLARMEMQIMNRALSEGAGSLINWGKNTQWAGRQLTVGLTVPITMFGAAAGKAFKEADAELVRLTKVYGGLAETSAADLKAIREEVVQTAKTLSKTMGASFKDTIALGADIAATGQTGNELLGSIAETTRLAILGEVDRQDAMKATLSIQTAFKQNTQELTESIDFLNAVENQTSTTLNDLVEAIPKAGPVIQQLGGSVKDLALYLTAMREGGISASEGANALKSGLASLINPTKQTVGMMSDFGIDVMGMVAKNTGDTTGLLMDLQKALDGLDPLSKARAMEQMFGKFQFARMSALLNNLGKQGSQTLQVLDLMKASTTDLAAVASRELKMVTESASGKYKRAIEGLKAELADVGEEFLGVATKLINAATKILDFFTGLPAPIKKALTFLAGFTALVGPLIMLTGVLANFFGYITKGIVQLRAFFMKANGWKMLTPEIIAAQKAAEMVENAFYSDAAAAQVLHNALQKLVLDYQNLQAASAKNGIPVNPGVSTVAGSPVIVAGRRVVDPTDPYVGDVNTRAMSHINPRDPNNPATIFGGVPGAVPVNRGISRTPQIYMQDRLPNIEGLTSIKGISTGIVPGEAAKFHALMATLGMQTEQEVAALKKTIAMGGTVSAELLETFDDILPITQRFADSAATQAAAIVQQMRNAEITVEQAKARILALNTQIEADMGAAVSMYAAGRGRTIDLTRAPMMDQPVVDANGQFTLRDLYKKKANASVMEEFGRLRGVRTFGAPYSIQTTRVPKFNDGGSIESFGPSKTTVSGPSSINYDDRLGNVPVGGYVLNQSASMDPANAPLIAMASATYENGGEITAALTPREVVFGPKIQRMPELYAAVDAANSGYNFGGQIMNGVTGYGKKTSKTPGTKMDERLFKKQYKEYLRFINNPRYEDDMRIRMIMLDAAELSYTAKMPMDRAIQTATSNFDIAKRQASGSDESFVRIRIKQVQDLEKKYPDLKVKNAAKADTSSSKALNYNLNKVRKAMMQDPRFAGVHDLISAVSPTTFKNGKGMPIIQGLHDRAHFRRRGTLGYMTSGYMGLAAVMPSGINNIMSRLETLGLSRDVLNLNAADARENFAQALKKTGMDRLATVDDLYAAVMDDGKFKTKAQIESGNTIKANKKQRDSWRMFLEAAITRQKWIPGRPPRLVPAYNLGGMIPGGSISRARSSYGFKSPALRLIAPDKQLKILQTAREMSRATATGSFKDMAPVRYGHMVAPSSGMSYPIPGVSGLYKDADGTLKFFKGVPNEISAKAELYGTRMAREVFGLDAPEQTIKTILNPLDPTGKTKLLGLESPFDKKFAKGGTKFTEDEMIRQTIASLAMNNKDLSPSNVFGNVLADVGAAGVFPRASANTEYAKTLPSMQEQAMINLLGVKGGARKDFAVNTAPIASSMTPAQYDRKIKAAMKKMHPKLVKFVATLPKEDRAPYIKLLQRFEAGMDTDFRPLHGVHVQAKRNSGGPIGGGLIQRGRYAYGGRPGNPAKRAEWERAKRERAAARRANPASSYTATGNPQMQVTRVPYVGGTGVAGNAYTGAFTPSAARTISTLRMSQFPYMNMPTMPMNIPGVGNTAAISQAFKDLSMSIARGTTTLRYGVKTSGTHVKQAYTEFAKSTVSTAKTAAASARNSSVSIINSSKAAAARLQTSILREQAAYTARHYPNGGFDPYQRSYFGPGLVGGWKDTGQEGVQKRKVGSLGFRKTEFMVNGQNMTRAQAQAAGVSVPGRGPMGMGAQMGIGMAGSMGSMALMSKDKVNVFGKEMSGMSAGMGLMAATTIIPMLPMAKMGAGLKTAGTGAVGLAKGFAAAARAGTVLAKIIPTILRFAKGFGPIGLAISTVFEGLMIYKKVQDDWQDARMGLSMTAKAAEQAGVKYFNLQEAMQGYLDKQKAVAIAAKASQYNSIGMPGLPKSVEDMKKAKEEGKALKDLIESINRSESTAETKRLISSQKAQYVASGMSVEEANRKIYGALLNSEKALQAYDILGNSAFGKIVDKATAAEFAVGNLINTLNKGAGTADWYKEVGSGFEGLINTFQAATNSLIGTKDELGNVIDEYGAYKLVMESSEKLYPGFTEAIGEEAFSNLAKTQPLLAGIANEADSIKGILAKWTLFTSGVNINLSKIDSTLAIKLAGFTEAIGTGISELTKATDNATTFSTVGAALTRLKKTIGAVSAASQRAANAAQRSAQEELKLIAKKIKLIEDEKNKKLEALRATQDASNYALELQKLQIEYADAVSRGDMATANRAQLDIDRLTLDRQTDLATKAIEDAANKAKAPLEKKATGIQDKSDANSVAGQIASDNASAASEIASTLTDFQTRYNEIVQRGVQAQLLPDSERKKEEKRVQESLIALAKEIQTAGTGNSNLSKEIRNAFIKLGLFDSNGKAVPIDQKTTRTSSPTGFDGNGKPILPTTTVTTGVNTALTEQFARDMKAVADLALDITGGTTLNKLRLDLLKALGKDGGANGDKSKTAGKKVIGTNGQPTKYYDGNNKEITREEYESRPAGVSAYNSGREEFTIPIDGLNGQTYRDMSRLQKAFFEANGGKGSYETYNGYIYMSNGVVYKDKKPVGRWWNYVPNGQGKVASYSEGGNVSGPGTPTSDSIPAMLSDGEYVVKASAVQQYGTGLLDSINTQKFHKGGPVHKHPHKPLATAPNPVTPISQLGKSTQAQVKYLQDWTALLNTYYRAKYKDAFDLPEDFNISSGLNIINVLNGTKKVKDPSTILDSQSGAYYKLSDRSINFGLGVSTDALFTPNPITSPESMSNLNNNTGIPYKSNSSPVDYLETISKNAQKNPYARMEILNTLFHEFSHAMAFNLKGYFKNTQSLMGLGTEGDPNKPTPGFSNVETSADLMAGGIFKEMYQNGYIPQIKDSILKTLFSSKILTSSFANTPNLESVSDDPNYAPGWHPYNENFRFKTWATGYQVGDTAAMDDSFVNRLQRLSEGGGTPVTFESMADTAAAKAAISADMIPKGFRRGGLAKKDRSIQKAAPRIKADGSLSAMIAAAESMLGYTEGEKDNDTFVGEWQDKNDSSITSRFISWCGAFMNWVANTAGVELDNMVYTPAGAAKFKAKDAFFKDPKVGDLAFFNWGFDNNQEGKNRIQHVGLVRSILSNSLIETIEGNTSEKEPPLVFPDGYKPQEYYDNEKLNRIRDGVFKRKRLYNHELSSIVGFGRPKYKGEEGQDGKLVKGGMTPLIDIGRDPMAFFNRGIGFANGGLVGKDLNPITKGYRWFKDAMNNGSNPASSMLMGMIEQAGYLGQTGLSTLTNGIIPKPTKKQDKDFQEFTGIPGAYRAVTGKTSEGPLGQDYPSAQKLMDWAALAGWAVPAAKGATTARGSLSTAAATKAVNRQGVQVFDRRLPTIVNDLMQVTGVKTKKLSIYDEILTAFQDANGLALEKNPSWLAPKIIPGKGTVNIYDPLQWDLRTTWQDGKRLGKIKDIIQVLRGKKEVEDNAAYVQPSSFSAFMPNNTSLRTLFHELGHRDLFLQSPTSKGILGDGFSANARDGVHEIYADRFSKASRNVFLKFWNKEWTEAHFQDPFKNGNSYVTNPGLSLIDDFTHYVGGIKTGRKNQVTPQFLEDYLGNSGPSLEQSAIDKINHYKTLFEIYSQGPHGKGGLQYELLQMLKALENPVNKANGGLMKLPKFEAGINMVPEDMLAMIHKNEAVIPANMNPFNPNATSSAIASGSVYNINVELNGTTVTAKDVAMEIHREMRIKEMAAGVNRTVGRS